MNQNHEDAPRSNSGLLAALLGLAVCLLVAAWLLLPVPRIGGPDLADAIISHSAPAKDVADKAVDESGFVELAAGSPTDLRRHAIAAEEGAGEAAPTTENLADAVTDMESDFAAVAAVPAAGDGPSAGGERVEERLEQGRGAQLYQLSAADGQSAQSGVASGRGGGVGGPGGYGGGVAGASGRRRMNERASNGDAASADYDSLGHLVTDSYGAAPALEAPLAAGAAGAPSDAATLSAAVPSVPASRPPAGNGSLGTDFFAESEVRLRSYGRGLETEALAKDPAKLGLVRESLAWHDGDGAGPQSGGDQYARITENPFQAISRTTTDNRLSTFSIDVDTASYANVRQFLMQSNTLPPPDAVRLEEMVNYFDYEYSAPTGDVPFDSNVEVAACPWEPEHRLVRVGIKGREMDRSQRPKSNLVFLIDVSGSMDDPAKLPLVIEGMRMLTRELGENDRVAIVVYASTEGLVLESTRGDQQQTILDALGRLSAGGSTAGGAGIMLAYKIAEENFVKDGVNRIILCTDGDFNVGVTSPAELERLAEGKAKDTGVFLTVLGFGRGNLNDAMMEQVADHGNGNYHYVDNRGEARKVLVQEMTGTLVTIAKDVKIQIEFNPATVSGYRLIGYENRVLAAEDFNNDKKDAGEIGAGHTVTALYEVIPAGQKVETAAVDELKYERPAPTPAQGVIEAEGLDYGGLQPAPNGELLTLKIRYKEPDGDISTKLEFPVTDNDQKFSESTADFQFASAVASFGMLLRGSEYKGSATYAGVLEIAESASRDHDKQGYRKEFVDMVRRAKELAGQ